MELRILTVALMKKDDCWVLCRKTELMFSSPENWTILGFFAIWSFFDFFAKTFDDSMEPWAKKIFEKIAPKHVWTLGNDFGQVLDFEFFPTFSLKFF